jgi:ribosomal protein S18 acetylase RimI-like enzyme
MSESEPPTIEKRARPRCDIRAATTADAAALATLGARTFIDAFGADNTAADIEAYVSRAYGVDQQRTELARPGSTFLIAEVDGRPAAYAYLRSAPIPAHVVDASNVGGETTVEIARFYVDAPFHGRGIAHALMDAAVGEAGRRGASALWLGVWERNARAIRFYTKQEFHDVGSQPFQLGSDLQQDRVMLRRLAPCGRLDAIWIKRMKRGPMDPTPSARLVTARGIVGNANQRGKRQVTIIEREVWERLMNELGADLSPSSRRANLMVSGTSLSGMRGRVLRVGEARIRIYGETKPCERMDEALPGLQSAMRPNWGGGAFGEILNDADIHVGDAVSFEPSAPSDAGPSLQR